jgi:hypothetical protein
MRDAHPAYSRPNQHSAFSYHTVPAGVIIPVDRWRRADSSPGRTARLDNFRKYLEKGQFNPRYYPIVFGLPWL